MKPNFALSLSFDGIGLLQRAPGGWVSVGEVALDTGDLALALADLRERALSLNAGPIRSKLIIPNEQIRYLSIPCDAALAADATALARQARAALDGATPYQVDELAYDFALSSGQLHIAAVARETLQEAEAFAADHGFEPVSFVAIPAAGDFPGEPFFDATDRAAGLLGPGESLTRDLQPIRVIGRAQVPQEPQDHADAVPDMAADDDMAGSGGAGSATDLPQGGPVAEGAVDAEGPDFDAEEPQAADGAIDPASLSATLGAATPGADTAPRFASIRAERGAPGLGQVGAAAPAVPSGLTAPRLPIEDDRLPAEPNRPRPPSTAAQQSDEKTGQASGPADPDARLAGGYAAARVAPATPAVATPRSEKQRMTIFGQRRPEASGAVAIGGKPRYLGLILTAILLVFLLGVAVWASVFTEEGISRLLPSRSAPVATATLDDLDAPYLVEGDEAEVQESIDLAALEPGTFGQATGIEAAPGDGADRPIPGLEMDAAELDAVAPDFGDDPTPGPASGASAPLDAQEHAARYAATGIWQMAPDQPDTPVYQQLDDLYVASIDPGVEMNDAIALPAARGMTGDQALGQQPSPAPAGTVFELDDRGLVRATPGGAVTPDGVQVFAGRPPDLPGLPPLRSAAAAPEATPEADDPLRETRPRARPDDLSDRAERTQLGGLTRSELAQERPRLRPAGLAQAAAAAAAREAAAAEAAEAAAAEAAAQAAAEQRALEAAVQSAAAATASTAAVVASAQAVPVSVRPNPRPRNFERTVQRAQPRASEPAPQPQQASARAAPSIPTSASVAREATVRNALRLNRMNLIGTYGKPSNRSALVRLQNGRYQKVQVGDRLDGGRVSAIRDGELLYTKGGRQISLSMPRG